MKYDSIQGLDQLLELNGIVAEIVKKNLIDFYKENAINVLKQEIDDVELNRYLWSEEVENYFNEFVEKIINQYKYKKNKKIIDYMTTKICKEYIDNFNMIIKYKKEKK